MDLQILINLVESAFNCTLQEFTYIVLLFAFILVPFGKWSYKKLIGGVFKK